jgi:hypothetical protein
MPTPDPDHYWPSCDDQPGVSNRPLRQADLAALLAHLDQRHHHGQDPADNAAGPGGPAPVLAVWVRASVGQAGASAHAQYRRRRAIEWAAWTRSLPWRAAAVLVIVALIAAIAATQTDTSAIRGNLPAWEFPPPGRVERRRHPGWNRVACRHAGWGLTWRDARGAMAHQADPPGGQPQLRPRPRSADHGRPRRHCPDPRS